jgi:sRNA-binding carbon storage regulator CsrA
VAVEGIKTNNHGGAKMLVLKRNSGESVSLFHEGQDKPFLVLRIEKAQRNQMQLTFFGGDKVRILRTELVEKQPRETAS